MQKLKQTLSAVGITSFFLFQDVVSTVLAQGTGVRVDRAKLGVPILSFGGLLTFVIRGFFMISGLAALFYLLLGAFAWVTAGGEKANVEKAQGKIRDAIVGLLIIVFVLAIMATLEQIVFDQKLCLGLTCDVSIPKLSDYNQFP